MMFFKKKQQPKEKRVPEIVQKVKFYGDLLEGDVTLGKISGIDFVKSREAFQEDVTNMIGRRIEELEKAVFQKN